MSAPRSLRVLGVSAALVVSIALSLSPAGWPLLARLRMRSSGRHDGGSARCPLALPASPDRLEAARAASMAPLRGPRPSPARPALGFALERTARAEVAAWASERGASCAEELGGSALRCQGFHPDEREATIQDLYARFDAGGRLVAVDVMRRGLEGEAAARRFSDLRDGLARVLGPPSASWGEPSASYLAAAPLRQAAARFRFLDYAADASATNLGGDGVVVREQYRSIPTGDGRP